MSGSLTNENISLLLKVRCTIWSLRQCNTCSQVFIQVFLVTTCSLDYPMYCTCLPVVVFTSIESWPYTPIHLQLPLVDINPLLLAFVHAGPGHYSLAFRKRSCFPKSGDNQETGNSKQTTNSYCCCGRGRSSSEKEHVANCSKRTEYSSHCPYSQHQVPVNSLNQ